ncbi:BTB/POZ domain-containing protein 3-like [Phlebotomus argentipes]|uniref:BTB/POZ domain-containing protein 3-like n=1 Tax=Phlebotomus argentipes TaxID=94469 RepID=UPI0028930B1D|nr:BTB/POZ domain-containing protein 3-like [Phlebotomus argentipes]
MDANTRTGPISNASVFWRNNSSLSKLIENKFLSDMIFVIGKEKRRVPGHKFIFSAHSWCFYNIFHNLKLDKDELAIEDVTVDAFRVFLNYCYTETAAMTTYNVFDVLKLAQKFEMEHLENLCKAYLRLHIRRDNCMQMYSKIIAFERVAGLEMKMMKIMDIHFEKMIEHDSVVSIFLDLPLPAVRKIIDRNYVKRDEMKFFRATMKWAKNACQKKNIRPNSVNLRTILGNVFQCIHFWSMKIEHLHEILIEYPGILSPYEISWYFRKFRIQK